MIISGDGNCLIFGSTGNDGADDSALQMGSVSIYCFDSGSNSWGSPRAVLHGDAAGDEFGSSVAINNDATYIAVGAIKYDDASAGTNAGSTNGYYVGDYFGYSLDISDLTDDDKIRVVIGAPNNGGTYYHGHARLYEADTTSTDPQWALVASDIDGRDNMSLGKSLAMSKTGERIVLGGPTYNSGVDSYYEGLVKLVEQTEISRMPSNVPSLSPSSMPSAIPSISLLPTLATPNTLQLVIRFTDMKLSDLNESQQTALKEGIESELQKGCAIDIRKHGCKLSEHYHRNDKKK